MQEVNWELLEKLVATAKENYPKMKTYDTRIDIARANLNRAAMTYFDIFSLSYLYNPNNTGVVNPNLNTANAYGYQLGLFVNIGGILQKPFIVRQARAERKLVEEEREVYHVTLEAEVRKRYLLYVQELALLKVHAQSLLDAEALLNYSRHRFEKGEEALNDYANVLITYSNHVTRKIIAETEVLIAKSNLEELLGVQLESIQ